MDDHVSKPVDPTLLYDVLSRWIKPRAPAPTASTMASPAARPVHAAPDGLPHELAPFDVVAALRRLNGNRHLLRKLLVDFHARYSSAMADLRGMLEQGQIVEAQRLAHTLRGVAGNLEVAAVTAAAHELELALRSGRMAAVPVLSEALADALAPALVASASLAGAETALPTVADAVADAKIADMMIELRELLSINSLQARDSFARLQRVLPRSGSEDVIATMASQIAALDFSSARSSLSLLERDRSLVLVER